MKKVFSIIILISVLIYFLVEFVGDGIIKRSLESNLSRSLGTHVKIQSLEVKYLGGKAEIEKIEIQNKNFPGKFLIIDKVFSKLNTSSIFSDKIEIDQIIIDGVNINYFFTLNKSLKVEDNIKPLKETISKTNNSSSSSSKKFIIKKLDIKNAKVSASSEKLNINQQISLKDMSFENVGNAKDIKDYKTILKDIFNKAIKSAKNKVLSGNTGNAIDKLKNIDDNKIKEKIKEEINQTKDKVKDKLKKLLN